MTTHTQVFTTNHPKDYSDVETACGITYRELNTHERAMLTLDGDYVDCSACHLVETDAGRRVSDVIDEVAADMVAFTR